MKTKLFLIFLIFLSFILVLASCQSSRPTSSSTLIVGLSDPPTSLDPRYATDANSKRLCDLIFSSLIKLENDLQVHPSVALSWKQTPTQITFHLKKIFFHNGRIVTLEDVKKSFDEYRKPASPFAFALRSVEDIKVLQPDLIIFKLNSPDGSLLSNLADLKILPPEAYGDSQFSRHPVGSGPLKFISWKDNEINLEPVQKTSKLKSFVFKFIRDENTRYLKIVKGDVDVLLNELQEDKVEELKKTNSAQVIVSQGLNFNYLILNLKDDRLKNIEVRRAIFAAIDRQAILKYTLHNLGGLATSILAPINPMSAPDLEMPSLPLEEAKTKIKEFGLLNSEFSLKTSDQALGNGAIVADDLQKNLGIKVNHESFEWATFYSDVKAGRFQMALMRWVGIVDPDVYRDTLSTAEFAPEGRNRGFYSNPIFDQIVERARHELNFEKRKTLYTKAQFIIVHDLPILPLWYNANISVLNFRIKNFKPAVTGSFVPLLDVTKD